MGITKRLMATIASGFALAAAPGAEGWKPRRPAPSGAQNQQPAGAPPSPPPSPERPEARGQPPTAASAPRDVLVFASGFVLAAAAAAALWLLAGADLSSVPAKMKATFARLQPSTPPLAQQATCNVEPATKAASEQDGRFPVYPSVEGLVAGDIASLIVIGSEAVSTGRPRDAEAAFLMSCRLADKLKGAGTVELADAKYHLGSHYARLAIEGNAAGGTDRAELLRRAEPLYLDSLQTFNARHGADHEKSQFAAQGLAAVRQTATQAKKVQPAPGPAAVAVAAPAPVPPPAPERMASPAASQQPPAQPGPVAALPPRPTPPKDAAVNRCPEAVAALGLCDPGH